MYPSGLRTGVLFCLLSFDAKTSFTVVVVVKDNLLGFLHKFLVDLLFYESLIVLGGCMIDEVSFEIWETLDSRNNFS